MNKILKDNICIKLISWMAFLEFKFIQCCLILKCRITLHMQKNKWYINFAIFNNVQILLWLIFSLAQHVFKYFVFANIMPVPICSFEYWTFEMIVLLSGLLPNPKLETSVLSIRFLFYFIYI